MTLSPFAQLDAQTQHHVRRAVERCTYRHCDATLDTVAADIIASRARRKDRQCKSKAA